MNRPLISIIVPVYNAALYIEECIASVLQQTIGAIEVIVVNDGSTDESAAILDRLAAADQRLRVFHCRNRGVSAARNFGIEKATGDYIGFVDADDWVEPTMFEILYAAMQQDCDLAICNVTIHNANGTKAIRLSLTDEQIDAAAERGEVFFRFMRFTYDNANWNKLYKREIIREHSLAFDEQMLLWEDLLFNLCYLHYVRKLSVLQTSLYNYRIQPASLTNTNKNNSTINYNRLYSGYEAFAKQQQVAVEWEIFRHEMARGCYNQLLHELAVSSRAATKSRSRFLFHYYRQVKQIQAGLFYFSDTSLLDWQGFKKRLLMYRMYFLYALLIVMQYDLKSNSN
jgi:glycosyltransferase involved in cell wall biosynthesis